jgi:hypothetical protein
VAVVELGAKNRKQVDGALFDLLTHPEPRKVLVIGRSKAVRYPKLLKAEIVQKVIPVLQSILKVPVEIGIFTEAELKLDASGLGRFIGGKDAARVEASRAEDEEALRASHQSHFPMDEFSSSATRSALTRAEVARGGERR